MTDKAIIAKSNNLKTKIVKTSKAEIVLTERKKDESNLKAKENIDIKALKRIIRNWRINSKIEFQKIIKI